MTRALALSLCYVTFMAAQARAGDQDALQKAIEQLQADPQNAEALKVAEGLLSEDQPSPRRLQAAVTLAKHKLLSDKTALALVALMKDADSKICFQAMVGLRTLGQQGSAAIPGLVAMLKADRQSMHMALHVLGFIKGPQDVVVPPVLKVFEETLPETLQNSKYAHLSTQAAFVLKNYPEAAPVIKPVLMAGIKKFDGKADQSFSGKAQRCDFYFLSLRHLTSADDLVQLYRELNDDGLRHSMLRTATADSAQRAALTREALKSDHPHLRLQALRALSTRIPNEAKLADVASLMKEKDEKVRSEVFYILERFGEDSIPLVVDTLKEDPKLRPLLLLMVSNPSNRWLSKATIPGLIACLKDGDEQVRYRACGALGLLGPQAKEAAPALKELEGEGPPFVRGAAAEALRRIENK